MFTSPPYPPKDYELKHVPKLQRDSAQFTPDSEPRVTQTTLGLFCAPIQYKEGETPQNFELPGPSPQIVQKRVKEARAMWVPSPGVDDFFIHRMFKKYNVQFDSYNPALRHMEKVFNRSYKYELVCLEEKRLEKLRKKCLSEYNQSELQQPLKKSQVEHQSEDLNCKAEPPFWWRKNQRDAWTSYNPDDVISKTETSVDEGNDKVKRWAAEPCLTAVVVDDPCRRKYDMQLVRLPYKTEACNYYYTRYPPPDIKFRPKKFL